MGACYNVGEEIEICLHFVDSFLAVDTVVANRCLVWEEIMVLVHCQLVITFFVSPFFDPIVGNPTRFY